MLSIVKTESELAAAITSNTPAKLVVRGKIPLKLRHVIRAPISIEGEEGAELALDGGSLFWTGTSKVVEPLKVKDRGEFLTGKSSLGRGNLFFVWSQDHLTDVKPHHPGGGQFGAELHMVNWTSSSGVACESFCVDDFQTSPVVERIEPLRGVVVRNLTISCAGKSQGSYYNAMEFNSIADLVIENVRLSREGGGAIVFDRCWNTRLSGLNIEGTLANDGVYGVVVGAVNGFVLEDSIITGCRHAFTTTASHSEAKNRWGTPLNVVVRNNIVNVPTKDSGASRLGLDTHAEGWGIIFDGNLVNIGTKTVNIGMQTRSRNTLFKNNIVRGKVPTKSLIVDGPNATVSNCIFEGGWYGVKVQEGGCSISGCSFSDFSSAAIWKGGHSMEIANCLYKNVGFLPSSGFKKDQEIRD